jgi:P27 family predicted phage terminase small subunit
MRDKPRRKRSQGGGNRKLPSKDAPNTGRVLPREPPERFGEHAKQWYRWAAKLANEMGIADEADSNAFECAAETYQEYRDAQACIEKHGMVLETDGRLYANPAVAILQRSARLLRLFRGDLGLTPSARAKFGAPEAISGDPLEELLGS